MIGLTVSPSAARAALPVVTIVVAVVTGVLLGVEISLLVIAAGALAGVIALLWSSVQALTGESPLTLDEALTLGAPSAEEEQKRAVLRALKDLEFERSVGKISEDDYAELSTRYREEAKRLIQLIDAGTETERERAEKALAQRLAATPAKAPEKAAEPEPQEADGDEPEAEAEPSSPAPTTASEREEEAT
ncbi:MAG TPA: hypothetical protein VFV94_09025 [Polyangiaceae bacterium]|jgi:hypothetical protein|nr:hypothetical protein [Polyangiaceae bacterium]